VLDDIVLDALREAVRQDNPVRLVTSGKRPENKGLFPKRAKPYTAAIALCLDKEKGLLEIAREERKGRTVAQFVTINEHGLEALAAHVPVEEYRKLLDQVSPSYRTRLVEKCLESVRRSSEQLDAERKRLLEVRQSTMTAAMEMATVYLSQLDAEKKQLNDKTSNLSELRSRLQSVPFPAPTPRTEEDCIFQRDISEQLVYAVVDASSQETRDALTRVLFNAGVEYIGEPGERVEFDARWQDTEDDLYPGDAAEVVKPGWRLVNQRGTDLLAKAKVKKAIPKVESSPCPQ
jgi:hypothetical protein